MNPNEGSHMMCKCPHHKMRPLALILIAVDVILANYMVWSVQTAITIAAVLVILAFLPRLMSCKCCMKKQ